MVAMRPTPHLETATCQAQPVHAKSCLCTAMTSEQVAVVAGIDCMSVSGQLGAAIANHVFTMRSKLSAKPAEQSSAISSLDRTEVLIHSYDKDHRVLRVRYIRLGKRRPNASFHNARALPPVTKCRACMELFLVWQDFLCWQTHFFCHPPDNLFDRRACRTIRICCEEALSKVARHTNSRI
jgi:hypothetical protein